ncbi:AAA family ATPase [Spirochaetota bacterium]
MKLAVTGKGGVGKTTISALLIQHFAGKGRNVIAVDADPDANLSSALGFEGAHSIVPIAEMEKLIEERTGAKPGDSGSFFKINPKVDDLPEKLSFVKDNIRLMVMGKGPKSGGCYCPESALLKSLISHLVFYEDDVVVMDMEAGIEHLGRGTASAVDVFIIVVEPGKRSLETAESIRKLASQLGIKKVVVVGNKIRGEKDEVFIKENIPWADLIGFIPYDQNFIDADIKGGFAANEFSDKIENIIANIN